jgi:uncharacterized damage-inducible protein DinB
MPENRDELLRHYRQTREQLLAAIDGLSDDLMLERSIDGWSVRDHLAHLAVWDEVRASEVERISAGHESAWKMSAAQDEAYNAMTHGLRADHSLAQVRWELETSRRKLLEAIASATERGLDTSLYGEAGLASGHEAEHVGWIVKWRRERGL